MCFNEPTLSANEAAYVAEIPLKKVHRIIDAGLSGDSVDKHRGARAIPECALLGLKLADETIEILTLEGRRRMARHVLDDPEAKTVHENSVSVDLRAMRSDVKRRAASLEKARKMIASDKDILGGTPCFKGTRIPIHDIVEMLANGDEAAAILSAYPSLTERQVAAAAIYAEAYPCRGRRRRPGWQKLRQLDSKVVKVEKLPHWS